MEDVIQLVFALYAFIIIAWEKERRGTPPHRPAKSSTPASPTSSAGHSSETGSQTAAKEPATATPTRRKCRHCCRARPWNAPSACRPCSGLFSRNAGTCSVCRARRTSPATILVAGCAATSSPASSCASRVALGSWWPSGCGGVRARRDLFSGSDKKHYKPQRPTATPENWQSATQSTSGASRRNAGALPSFAISPRTASLCSVNPKGPNW